MKTGGFLPSLPKASDEAFDLIVRLDWLHKMTGCLIYIWV